MSKQEYINSNQSSIVELYNNGISSTKIAKKFDVNSSYIHNILYVNAVKIRSRNKYSANYDYFQEINSDERAYILGLLYADGHVKTNTQVWGISLIDEWLVKEVAKRVEYTGKIHYKKPAIRFNNNLCKAGYELSISSPKMKEDLIQLGCIPKKTLILKYPTLEQVPLEFRSAFIRGYCDGDGSIGFSLSKNEKSPRFKVQFTSTKEMCEGIMNEIISRGLCDTGIHIYKANNKSDKNTHYLFVDGIHCVRFLDWIYNGSTIHLERKWRKYMQLKEYFEYRHLLVTPAGRKKKV